MDANETGEGASPVPRSRWNVAENVEDPSGLALTSEATVTGAFIVSVRVTHEVPDGDPALPGLGA